MSKKKILFCEIYDDGTVGGSHSTLFNLVSRLDKSKFEPTVAFYSTNLYCDEFEKIGVPVNLLNKAKPSRFTIPWVRKAINWNRMIRGQIKYFEKIYKDGGYDIVVINNTLYTAKPYIAAAKNVNIPIVVYERGINTFSKSELGISSYISASIAVSDAVLESIKSQNIQSQQVVRVYDGIAPPPIESDFDRNDVLKEFSIPENSVIVGILGNVKPWKGQKYFVEAVASLQAKFDNLYGLVVGGCADRDKQYMEELKVIIKQHGLENRILFTGYRSDAPRLLRVFDVFVHASTKPEPFGMVIPEAMAAKVPVIATNFGGPPESLNHGQCGILVPPENSDEIAKGVTTYLKDSDYRRQVVDLAYERYKEYFVLEKNVLKVEEILINSLA